MLRLEEIRADAQIEGLMPGEPATIIAAKPVGEDALSVVYRLRSGEIKEHLVYREDEPNLSLASKGLAWSFDSPCADFKLALEAKRIELGVLFDPMMAIHTSDVEPLPHQISAVYDAMLSKQPLRFVLADDPGAGKTVMAGLLIKELLMRADAQRVLIVTPGSLTEQWQDEMRNKFSLEFHLFTREQQEASASGNYFADEDLLIARVDQLARSEDLRQRLEATRWDLVVVDEAHKLSAHRFGKEVKKTHRYQLGELLGGITRHFLLMTATPHNGKEEDFRLWLALLDPERFYGDGHDNDKLDLSDVMRRMVKEKLLRFDGTRLFPKRLAYTVNYRLSDREAALYDRVTQYVVEEMDRADRLEEGRRKGQVGFALTMLQRRLASSPEAIHQSLRRRRERLEAQLREQRLAARGLAAAASAGPKVREIWEGQATYQEERRVDLPEDLEDLAEELSPEEYDQVVEKFVSGSSAAGSAAELEREVGILADLTREAEELVRSGGDRKWETLSEILQDRPEMRDESGARRKLIVFTEHRDTLEYLQKRIAGLLGDPQAVRVIHGGTNRDTRRQIQEDFRNDPDVLILIATDAAGEGVNLQRANLLVNYDLPWNPNRLEQRFGRIHRIGQTETCHMWNQVANETREGEVFQILFRKLENERVSLGGRVFDILGDAFDGVSLKELLLKAIREGQTPEAKRWMTEKVNSALNTEHLREIIRRNALVDQTMTPDMLFKVKEEMDRAEARKLQPCFVRSFFLEAFASMGGQARQREPGRYEIPNVPLCLRENARRAAWNRTPIARKYGRICFEKEQVRPSRSLAEAAFIHPGHPLMHSLTDLVLVQKGGLLKPGTVMVDPLDEGVAPSLIFLVEHSVRENEGGRLVSRRLQFVRLTPDGRIGNAGWAPHLDLAVPSSEALELAQEFRRQPWMQDDLEGKALDYAAAHLARDHFQEVRARRAGQADRIQQAVRSRLIRSINYWTRRAEQLRQEVEAGKQPRMQPLNARQTAQDLSGRLRRREAELDRMRNVVSCTPVVIGGILVVPQGALNRAAGIGAYSINPAARSRTERLAMEAVMAVERGFGHAVEDVSAEKCGWDVTARPPRRPGAPIPDARHIEVKGREKGAASVTLTRNEICYAVNQKDRFILAIVLVDGDCTEGPYYIRNIFTREPGFGEVSTVFDLKELLSQAVRPEETLDEDTQKKRATI